MVAGKGEQKWKAKWVEQLLGTGDGRKKWLMLKRIYYEVEMVVRKANKDGGPRVPNRLRILLLGRRGRNCQGKAMVGTCIEVESIRAHILRGGHGCVQGQNKGRIRRRKLRNTHGGEGGSRCKHHKDGWLDAV
jgi:hypothetical protein